MARVDRYKDTKTQCWSRVVLDSGEPIYIGIARSSVIVKKINLGIFGAKMYDQSPYIAAKTATILDEHITKYEIPSDMTDIVLMAFTQTALESKSADELKGKLELTLKES